MVENQNCLIWKKGPWIPCRGMQEGKPSLYFPDDQGRCPFSQCIAAIVLSDPRLLARIIDPGIKTKQSYIRAFVFNAICPGHINDNADEKAIDKYSADKPFYPNFTP